MSVANWLKGEYKRRHDNEAKFVQLRLSEKYRLGRTQKWYEHEPEGITENNEYKNLRSCRILQANVAL